MSSTPLWAQAPVVMICVIYYPLKFLPLISLECVQQSSCVGILKKCAKDVFMLEFVRFFCKNVYSLVMPF